MNAATATAILPGITFGSCFTYLRTAAGQQWIEKIGAVLGKNGRILLLAVPIAIIEILMRHRFPHWQDFIHDWTNHAHFITVFIYGYVLFASSRLQEAVWLNRRRGLWMGVVGTAVYFITVLTFHNGVTDRAMEVTTYIVQMAARGFSEWGWIVAMLGYGRQYLNRPHPWLRYASEIAYPFYILHQTVIVIIGYYVLRWSSSIVLNYVIISMVALLLTLALCELIKQRSFSRVLFGMKPLRQ